MAIGRACSGSSRIFSPSAIESTPAGGTIEVSLAREGAMARLRVR